MKTLEELREAAVEAREFYRVVASLIDEVWWAAREACPTCGHAETPEAVVECWQAFLVTASEAAGEAFEAWQAAHDVSRR